MLDEFLAYGEQYRPLETVMRMHAVKRWHMIDTTRQQTLAEHSANVAMLAGLVARTAPINWFDTASLVIAAALHHDCPESFTGDIPSHTKKFLLGADAIEYVVACVEFDYSINEHTRALIKLCDIADGIRFIRLYGIDLTARHAQEGLEAQFHKKFHEVIKELGWCEDVVAHLRGTLLFYAYERS